MPGTVIGKFGLVRELGRSVAFKLVRLSDRLRDGPVALREAVRIAREVAKG